MILAGLCGAAMGHSQPYRLGQSYFWPTPNPAFVEGRPEEAYLQPTVSGNLESALFGCVRNDGRRFHEGVDLKSIQRDGRGESVDAVYAFDAGVIRYVNRDAKTSSYGNYLVIEHPHVAPGFVSLYAHLRAVPARISPGVEVEGGERIAVMGRSAGGYAIPRGRAHLHFEVGLWLGPDFQMWYDRQPFDSENDHGAYNGLNIVGYDVWSMLRGLRSGQFEHVRDFLEAEPVAVVMRIRRPIIPEVLQINPQMMTNTALPGDLGGWEVALTWYGAPLRWTALSRRELGGSISLELELRDTSQLLRQPCADLIHGGSMVGPGSRLNSLISRLFVRFHDL